METKVFKDEVVSAAPSIGTCSMKGGQYTEMQARLVAVALDTAVRFQEEVDAAISKINAEYKAKEAHSEDKIQKLEEEIASQKRRMLELSYKCHEWIARERQRSQELGEQVKALLKEKEDAASDQDTADVDALTGKSEVASTESPKSAGASADATEDDACQTKPSSKQSCDGDDNFVHKEATKPGLDDTNELSLASLLRAAEDGNIDQLQLILKPFAAKSEIVHGALNKALAVASSHGHTIVVDELVSRGADALLPQQTYDHIPGQTALHLASMHGQTAVVKSLLNCDNPKLLVDAVDSRNLSALYYAVQGGHTDTIGALMRAGAEFDDIEASIRQGAEGQSSGGGSCRMADDREVATPEGSISHSRDSVETPVFSPMEARLDESFASDPPTPCTPSPPTPLSAAATTPAAPETPYSDSNFASPQHPEVLPSSVTLGGSSSGDADDTATSGGGSGSGDTCDNNAIGTRIRMTYTFKMTGESSSSSSSSGSSGSKAHGPSSNAGLDSTPRSAIACDSNIANRRKTCDNDSADDSKADSISACPSSGAESKANGINRDNNSSEACTPPVSSAGKGLDASSSNAADNTRSSNCAAPMAMASASHTSSNAESGSRSYKTSSSGSAGNAGDTAPTCAGSIAGTATAAAEDPPQQQQPSASTPIDNVAEASAEVEGGASRSGLGLGVLKDKRLQFWNTVSRAKALYRERDYEDALKLFFRTLELIHSPVSPSAPSCSSPSPSPSAPAAAAAAEDDTNSNNSNTSSDAGLPCGGSDESKETNDENVPPQLGTAARSLDLSPKDVSTAHFNVARCAHRLQKHLIVIKHCKLATAREKGFIRAWKLLGDSAAHVTDFSCAARAFSTALTLLRLQQVEDVCGDKAADRDSTIGAKSMDDRAAIECGLRDAKAQLDKSHYEWLGVEADAMEPEIRKTYRKLCLKWHPDKQQGKGPSQVRRAQLMYARVQAAYEVTQDTVKRTLYDAELRLQQRSNRVGQLCAPYRDNAMAAAMSAAGLSGQTHAGLRSKGAERSVASRAGMKPGTGSRKRFAGFNFTGSKAAGSGSNWSRYGNSAKLNVGRSSASSRFSKGRPAAAFQRSAAGIGSTFRW